MVVLISQFVSNQHQNLCALGSATHSIEQSQLMKQVCVLSLLFGPLRKS